MDKTCYLKKSCPSVIRGHTNLARKCMNEMEYLKSNSRHTVYPVRRI